MREQLKKVLGLGGAKRRAGFTLVELLVVIAILGVLVGLVSVAAVRMLRGSDSAERNAAADIVKSAIAAYQNENNGEWPIDLSGLGSNTTEITYGTVNNSNRVGQSNAEFLMPLFGCNANGKRDTSMRAYIEDPSMFYVCDGNSAPRKLEEVLDGGSISANDMIGFPIDMRETRESKYDALSGSQAFAPIRITIDFDTNNVMVTVPSDGGFGSVLRIN